jgi:dienelactone hydrolase
MERQFLAVLLMVIFFGTTAEAKVVGRAVAYEQGGVQLEGYLAYDDAVTGKRPGVIVVHEWWGLNEYARGRADQLARLGYVAFAVDMYGKGRVTKHPEQAGAWAKEVNSNIQAWRQRALAGLEVLRKEPMTDPERIAAIGYCFGGATVQQLAYSGADIRGIRPASSGAGEAGQGEDPHLPRGGRSHGEAGSRRRVYRGHGEIRA